jgi:4-amino-4-deoxy-L-arabinose transferase-like glycosyltransferase
MTAELRSDRISRVLLVALALLAAARLVSLAFYPLMDMTEARYADIARRMAASGDWVTPFLDGQRAFWGKPALSFWATAGSLNLFGVNAWSARFPHFLMGVGVAGTVWLHARGSSRRVAWHAVVLLAGSLVFLLAAGAVMTDMALVLGTTLVMTGYWLVAGQGHPGLVPRLALVAGLAIGLLAKGPLALVLCGGPIFVWTLWRGRWREAWQRVPWGWGLLAVLVLVLPWYLLAEHRSPGFLRYFIVGEHIERFLVRGWTGDLYSNAHGMPRGAIWVFVLVAALPWALVLPLGRLFGAGLQRGSLQAGPERGYLLAWALWPCIFFSLAGNILWTYVLPALPALALLGAGWTALARDPVRIDRLLATVLVLLALATPALLVFGNRSEQFDRHTLQPLVEAYQRSAGPGEDLLEVPNVSFSTDFYARGRARPLRYGEDLPEFAAGQVAYMIIPNDLWENLSPRLRSRLPQVAATPSHRLVRWPGGPP